MGAFLEQYGIAIFVLIIVGIMVLMANGMGHTVENLVTQEIKRFTDKSVSENKKVVNNGINTSNNVKLYYNKVYLNEEIGTAVLFQEDGTMFYVMGSEEEHSSTYIYEDGIISALGMEFILSEEGKTIQYFENNTLIFELTVDLTEWVMINHQCDDCRSLNHSQGTDYKYEIGMTWEEFINSDYSNSYNGEYYKTFKLENGTVYNADNHGGEYTKVIDSNGNEVKGTDLISNENKYFN